MRIPTIALIVISVCAGLAASAGAEVRVIDRIVAIVNGEIITLSELQKYKSVMYFGQPNKPSGRQEEYNLLNQLIEKMIIVQEAQNLDIKLKKKDIQEAIDNILKRGNITLEDMKRDLAAENVTMEDYRTMVRMELLSSRVVGREVQSKIAISDSDMENYYKSVIEPKEKEGARVRIQQILLAAPPGTPPEKAAEAERVAEDILQKLRSGEQFGRLAFEHSQGPAARMGGDLGYFHKGEMLPEIENVAFSMEKDSISDVIRSAAGFHIIKVLDKDMTAEDRSWKDHQREIEGRLYSSEFERNYQAWLQGLKEKSYIEIKF